MAKAVNIYDIACPLNRELISIADSHTKQIESDPALLSMRNRIVHDGIFY